MNIGVDVDGVLTDYERTTIDYGTKMCVEENWPINIDLRKYYESEKFNFTEEQEEKFLFRFLIPKSNKQSIMRQLDHIGINAKTLFPGLGGIGKYIERKYRFD